ncbi:MAG: hypothetical protein CRN43_01790 [Candidatus Nephrothrix sp. EaCA]|nr:MAG: hypothetical protein CRN43_01790 [Candidatus Nephrothrix sp. EaCA]
MDSHPVIDEYLKWMKDNTLVKTLEEGKIYSISTPFLDRHNDCLDIYMIKNNGSVKLTDNGYTIADLKMSGFELNTPKRESILNSALNGFGVKMNENNELFVEAAEHNIGQKKHCLLQAILAVNDMFNMSQETVCSRRKA